MLVESTDLSELEPSVNQQFDVCGYQTARIQFGTGHTISITRDGAQYTLTLFDVDAEPLGTCGADTVAKLLEDGKKLLKHWEIKEYSAFGENYTQKEWFSKLYQKHYSEFIKDNKDKGYDLIELTNRAINYCGEKLGLKGRMPVSQ